MVRVDIHTDTRYPLNRRIIRKAVIDTLDANKVSMGEVEVSVAVVGRRKMKVLTDAYLHDELEHEVLAFPYEDLASNKGGFISPPDNVLRLGDIALCWPEIVLLASAEDIMVDEQVYKLTVHATEHLLGKHHE